MFALSPSKRDSLWACGTLTLFICCTLYYYYSLSCFCNTLYLSACSYITGITILMILNSLKIDFPLLTSILTTIQLCFSDSQKATFQGKTATH